MEQNRSLSRLRGDAREAFTAYFGSPEYQSIRNRQLYRYFPNHEDRKDCGQLVDLKVYSKLFEESMLRPDYAFEAGGVPRPAYVQVVVTRTCIDYLRTLQRYSCELGGEAVFDVRDQSPVSDPAVADDDDRIAAEFAGDDATVASDIHLVMLRTDFGYTYEEMGRMLFPDELDSVPASTLGERARKRVEAAIRRLHGTLGPALRS